jgi:hypothetical protein
MLTQSKAKLIEDAYKPFKEIAELISSIFFYGNFKVETPAEAELEKKLIEVGLWPTNEDDIIKRREIRETKNQTNHD